jgi:DNA-directed RNA polymerase specialized sigma24 family protein
MTFEDLFEKYNPWLIGIFARLGIEDPMQREDLAQDTWVQLWGRIQRLGMPNYPRAWIRTVAQRRMFERLAREGRMRGWEAEAAKRHQATGQGPFRIDNAVAAAGERLTIREQEILDASQTAKDDNQLARKLGLPDRKSAQTARSRVKKRMEDILQNEADVSFMFTLTPDPIIVAGLAADAGDPDLDWDSIDEAMPSSDRSRESLFKRVKLANELARRASSQIVGLAPLGSFAKVFDDLIAGGGAGSPGEWAEALGVEEQDVTLLRQGERTVLELDPDKVVLLTGLLGVEVREAVLSGLGDLGLRAVADDVGLSLKEALLPPEEADIRIAAVMEEADVQA